MDMDERSADGALFIRGVGSSAPDASFRAASTGLKEYGVDLGAVREVNWSWTESIRWPFGADSRTAGDIVAFLRALGPSVLNCARIELPTSAGSYGRVITNLASLVLDLTAFVPLIALYAVAL